MNYYLDALKKYAVFSGRASRKEFWMFFLFNFIIMFLVSFFQAIINFMLQTEIRFISQLYSLFIFIPTLALSYRRAHDVNNSGWFLLIPIYNFIIFFLPSTQGPNNYGSGFSNMMTTEQATNPSVETITYPSTPTPSIPANPILETHPLNQPVVDTQNPPIANLP